MTNFDIIRRASIDPLSLKFSAPAARGLAFGIHSTNHRQAILATGTNFVGFSLQEMDATGPGLREAIFEIGSSDTGLQNAVKQGYDIAVEDVNEVEFVTDTYHIAGTSDGALTVDTKVGAKLSFKDGKFKEAVTNEFAFFEVLYAPSYAKRSQAKTAVKVATAAALPNTATWTAGVFTAGSNAAISIDGVALNLNDRVLVLHGEASDAEPTDSHQNGIYTVTTKGSGSVAWKLTRDTAADAKADFVVGDNYFVQKGTTNGNTLWQLTTATIGTGVNTGTNVIEFEKQTIDSDLTFRVRRLHGYVK